MYTQELINEVKEVYPNDDRIHRLAESGDTFLGRYLDDSSSGSISIDKILLATSLDDLQKIARHEKRKSDLYRKWCEQDPRKKIAS